MDGIFPKWNFPTVCEDHDSPHPPQWLVTLLGHGSPSHCLSPRSCTRLAACMDSEAALALCVVASECIRSHFIELLRSPCGHALQLLRTDCGIEEAAALRLLDWVQHSYAPGHWCGAGHHLTCTCIQR